MKLNTWSYVNWDLENDDCNIILESIFIKLWMDDDILDLPLDAAYVVLGVVFIEDDVYHVPELSLDTSQTMSSSDHMSVRDQAATTEYVAAGHCQACLPWDGAAVCCHTSDNSRQHRRLHNTFEIS